MIKVVILIGGPMKGKKFKTPSSIVLFNSFRYAIPLKLFCSRRPAVYLVLQNILPKLDLDSSFSGTRFRPLSLELPKPLFPIGGFPVVYHHIEACVKVQNELRKMSNA